MHPSRLLSDILSPVISVTQHGVDVELLFSNHFNKMISI